MANCTIEKFMLEARELDKAKLSDSIGKPRPMVKKSKKKN
jgi:hypothetical protein